MTDTYNPPETSVERVARAAFDTDGLGGHHGGGPWTWESIPEVGRVNYRAMAECALRTAHDMGWLDPEEHGDAKSQLKSHEDVAKRILARLGLSWEPDRSVPSALAKLGARVELEKRTLDALVSGHDGIHGVWVCDRCGQPVGRGARCNSGLHVGPDDGNAFNGVAVHTTDLVAKLNTYRKLADAVDAWDRDRMLDALRACREADAQ